MFSVKYYSYIKEFVQCSQWGITMTLKESIKIKSLSGGSDVNEIFQ